MVTAEVTPANLGAPSANKVLRHLKRQEQGLYNCVASIVADAAFVQEMAALHPELPVAANLRCGAWYVPRPHATCYFKSMDGHAGQWAFSAARLNWHLALLAAGCGGCFVVDATRRGKTSPDALTKTIPIWAVVLNRAVACVRDRQAAAATAADQMQSPVQHSKQENEGPAQPPQRCHCKGHCLCSAQPCQGSAVSPPAPASQQACAATRTSAILPAVGTDADAAHSCGEAAVGRVGNSCSSNWGGGGAANAGVPCDGHAAGGGSNCSADAVSGRGAGDVGAAAGWDTELHLPLWISASERQQIEARLPGFVQQLLEVGADVAALAAALRKPLRPLWLSPASRVWLNHVPELAELPFTPLFLVSASQPERRRMMLSGGLHDADGGSDEADAVAFDYVPGAGDDEESWARGLTPALLWRHQQALLAAGPASIAQLAAQLVVQSCGAAPSAAGADAAVQGQRRPHSGAARPPDAEDPHRPSPLGCAPEADLPGGPPAAIAAGACLLWRLGGTGVVLAQLPAGIGLPAEVWRHVDAVLDMGSADRRDSSNSAIPAAAGAVPARQQDDGAHSRHASAGGHAGGAGTACCGATACCSGDSGHSAESNGSSSRSSRGLTAAGDDAAQPQQQQQRRHLWRHVLSAKERRTSLVEALPAIVAFAATQLRAKRRLLIGSDEGLGMPAAAAVAVLLACGAPTAGERPGDWVLQAELCCSGNVAERGGAPVEDARQQLCSARPPPLRQDTDLVDRVASSGAADAGEPQQQCAVQPPAERVHKADLRRCLAFVSGHCPEARPSQGLLKQVFAHFEIIGGHNRHFQARAAPT